MVMKLPNLNMRSGKLANGDTILTVVLSDPDDDMHAPKECSVVIKPIENHFTDMSERITKLEMQFKTLNSSVIFSDLVQIKEKIATASGILKGLTQRVDFLSAQLDLIAERSVVNIIDTGESEDNGTW